MKDKISIIVPVYNVEKYLSDCLDSIINQTYKNIEIIVINDGSTDNSGKICDKYAKKDKRVKVVHQKNKGLSASRNKGIKISNGNYLSFVDSDDVIHSKMIEILYKEIIKNECEIAICKFKEFVNNYIEVNDEYRVQIINQDRFFKMLMIDKEITNHACNKLFKRELFDNIEFIVGKKYEDIGTIYKLGFSLNFACYLNIELYGYRIRNNSIINNLKKDTLLDYIEMTNYRYNDLLIRKPEIKNYIDMNRINSITRYFLMIAMHNKKELFKDKELKEILDNELKFAKKIKNKDIIKINTSIENIVSRLLITSPILFFYVMSFFYKLRSLRKIR